MTKEEWAEFNFINEQLEYMEHLGIIENLMIEVGDSLLTSHVKFSFKEEMMPLIMKSEEYTVH